MPTATRVTDYRTRSPHDHSGGAKTDKPKCHCVACAGLECLERPRYFAGQLLTEAELTSEQGYVLAKNRLHNRYLHGTGVVCGLEVVCHECKGWVTVRQGYAIDPCGNDIVVCRDESFSLLEKISMCREKIRPSEECDPVRPDRPEGCVEGDEHWCITLEYDEKEARPTTMLRRETSSDRHCGCSGSTTHKKSKKNCFCQGGDESCGCGCEGEGAKGTRKPERPGACEPTRTIESYNIGVCKAPPEHCRDWKIDFTKWIRYAIVWRRIGLTLPWSIVVLIATAENAPDSTLLGRIAHCFRGFNQKLRARISAEQFLVLRAVLIGQQNAEITAQQYYAAYCAAYWSVRELFEDHSDYRVRCEILTTLNDLVVEAPTDNESARTYYPRIRVQLLHLITVAVQYIIDCICMALMPSCSPAPCDDRLIIGCVVVRNDTIVRICNWSCRRYAGSFPALSYWFSFGPLIAQAVSALCCRPDLVRKRSPLVNDLLALLDKVDPGGTIRKTIAENDFALPRRYASAFREMERRTSAADIIESIRPKGVNVSSLVDRSGKTATERLSDAGVNVVTEERAEPPERPFTSAGLLPFANSGDRVTLYTTRGKVTGFSITREEASAARPQPEIDTLRGEVAALRRELDALKKGKRNV